MILRLQPGIDLDGLHWSMVRALYMAMLAGQAQGMPALHVTSAVRPSTGTFSLHPSGRALDIRRWDMPDPERFAAEMRADLGGFYDVVLEVDHLHVEYQPVRGRRPDPVA